MECSVSEIGGSELRWKLRPLTINLKMHLSLLEFKLVLIFKTTLQLKIHYEDIHNNDRTNYETLGSRSANGCTLLRHKSRQFDSPQRHDIFKFPKRPYEIWSPSSLLLNGQSRQSGRSVKLFIHLNPVLVSSISGAATCYKSLKSLHGVHWDKFRFALISMRQLLQQVSTKMHLKYAHM